MLTDRQKNILEIVQILGFSSISEIKKTLGQKVSVATLNRDLTFLVKKRFLERKGKGRNINYCISQSYQLFVPIDEEAYFKVDIDNRRIKARFNFDILKIVDRETLFDEDEEQLLSCLKKKFQENITQYTISLYQKELERLTIELSWKSAQIEGNTYSLLETERLFLEREIAFDKPKEDTIMLLNHKAALSYILQNPKRELSKGFIEEVHSLIVQGLDVSRNLRTRTVGITGTLYKPLDNVYQIEEAVQETCALINEKENGFEKALLAVLLLSYIQPFEDGNKRTARMISTSLLLNYGTCPLSYRSIDPIMYKKAMVLFYEQNSLYMFKKIFIDQAIFASKQYFQ